MEDSSEGLEWLEGIAVSPQSAVYLETGLGWKIDTLKEEEAKTVYGEMLRSMSQDV